jgi:hypothetical protein
MTAMSAEQPGWGQAFRNAPDRVALCVSFVVFGVWSGIVTVRAPGFGSLHTIFLLFDIEFVVVGLLLLIGMHRNRRQLNRIAHQVIAAAMVMLAVVLLVINQSPFAVLALAFGLQGFAIARMTRDQEQLARNILAMVEADRVAEAHRHRT